MDPLPQLFDTFSTEQLFDKISKIASANWESEYITSNGSIKSKWAGYSIRHLAKLFLNVQFECVKKGWFFQLDIEASKNATKSLLITYATKNPDLSAEQVSTMKKAVEKFNELIPYINGKRADNQLTFTLALSEFYETIPAFHAVVPVQNEQSDTENQAMSADEEADEVIIDEEEVEQATLTNIPNDEVREDESPSNQNVSAQREPSEAQTLVHESAEKEPLIEAPVNEQPDENHLEPIKQEFEERGTDEPEYVTGEKSNPQVGFEEIGMDEEETNEHLNTEGVVEINKHTGLGVVHRKYNLRPRNGGKALTNLRANPWK